MDEAVVPGSEESAPLSKSIDRVVSENEDSVPLSTSEDLEMLDENESIPCLRVRDRLVEKDEVLPRPTCVCPDSTRALGDCSPFTLGSQDNLGSLAAGTLIMAAVENSPMWPARVMGYHEAISVLPKGENETMRTVRKGHEKGLAVRYFQDKTVGILEVGQGAPFVPVDKEGSAWLWKSSKVNYGSDHGGKVPHNSKVKEAWDAAVLEATQYVEKCANGRHSASRKAYGSLQPGTLVFGVCGHLPYWPGEVITRERALEFGVHADKDLPADEVVPVKFFANKNDVVNMSVSDIELFIAEPQWADWYYERSLANIRSRGWRKVTRDMWGRWENAIHLAGIQYWRRHYYRHDQWRPPLCLQAPPCLNLPDYFGRDRRVTEKEVFLEENSAVIED